jgi:UDP-N-acetylglucosamine 4,6-dehydratase
MKRKAFASALDKKRILITGGTGSFGHQILRELLNYNPAYIAVLSRDEKKQYDMQDRYKDRRIRFVLGDVRDLERVRETARNIDILFHAAALKQVPNCEFAPMEAVQTNIIGAENIRRAAIEAGVDTVISISTDKAVKPVNVMGMSKAIQERILLQPSLERSATKFVCVRYGNVLGSRGSIIPLFRNLILDQKPLTITHPEMTRFQLTLKQAVELVLWATIKGKTGDLWVRKMPAAKIITLAKVCSLGLTGRRDYPCLLLGARPGEKMHEVLVSEEEMWRAHESKDYYIIPSWARSQKSAGPKRGAFPEYASNSVHQLGEDELFVMLKGDGWFDKKRAPYSTYPDY